MTSRFVFHRPTLARQFAEALLGDSPFADRAGMFLAAPRRTGKTTLLTQDLVPELQTRGAVPVYVDLWADRSRAPGSLIAEAIKAALRATAPSPVKAARTVGRSKLGLGSWLSFDLDRLGTPDGPTLVDALRALAERTRKPIVLIVDEAQQALASEAGIAAMFALKSARDTLNETGAASPRLALVLTGSQRDKLAHLVLRRDQPFFGARVTDFPLLGRDYTDAYTAWLNARLAPDNQFRPDDVFAAFDALGHRPEKLVEVCREAALGGGGAASLGAALTGSAKALQARLWEDYEAQFSALSPLQRAVLVRLIETGEAAFAPFAEPSRRAYAQAIGQEVTAQEAQAALEALRDRGLVWRSARGSYALEDQGFATWHKTRSSIQHPPDRSQGG